MPAGETLRLILRNIAGNDLNPLAVLSARANYIFALGDLLQARTSPIEIPIHLQDSIHPSTTPDVDTEIEEKLYVYVVEIRRGSTGSIYRKITGG